MDEKRENIAIDFQQGEFVISRQFDAPRELVFGAFTDPRRMKQWWGPKGFSVLAVKTDLRPDGICLYGLQAPDGSTLWGKFVFREIIAPQRLVFINSFSNEAGGITRHPMNPTWPLELLTTITFDETAGGTLLTVRWALLSSTTEAERKTFFASHDDMQQGWTGTLDQLDAYLAKARD